MGLSDMLLHAFERLGLDSAADLGTEVHAARASRAFSLDERRHGRMHRLHTHVARLLVLESQLAHQPLALVVQHDVLGWNAGVHLLRVLGQLLLAGATEAVAQHAQTPQLLVAAHRFTLHRVALGGTSVLVLIGQMRHRFGQHVRPVGALVA